MQLAIGPFVPTVDADFPGGLFALPAGVRSALELHGPDTAANPHAVFSADDGVRLSRDLTILRDDTKSRDAIASIFGYRPQGNFLHEWLFDTKKHGDPNGIDRVFPSMPLTEGVLRFRFAEWLIDEPFRFGTHPHTSQVQAVVQRDIRASALRELSRTGKADHTRRMLDCLCDELGLRKDDPSEWGLLVPSDIRGEIEGPLRHETTLTESFTKADGAGWGPTLTWVQASGGIAVSSNRGALGPASGSQGYHTNTVSSANHYSECDIVTRVTSASSGVGPGARHTGTSTNTMYYVRLKGADNNSLQMYRFSSGSAAELQTDTGVTISGTNRTRIRCDGDQISAHYQGASIISLTNGNITSGVCGAVRGNESVVDNYEISDLAAPATFTATGALTASAQTLSGAATFAPGTKTATGTLTASSQTLNGSAEFDAPVFSATGSLTTSAQTLSGSAEFTAPTYSADGSLIASSQTITGAAEFDAPIYSATGTLSATPQTISGTAEFDAPIFSATGTLSTSSQTLSGSATFEEDVPNEFNASGSLIVSSQSISGAGEFDAPVYESTGTLTASSQTLSGTAVFAAEIFSASGSLVASSQTIAASAEFTPPARQAEVALVVSSQVLSGSAEFDAPIFEAAGTLVVSSQTLSGAVMFAEEGFNATGSLVVSSQTISGVMVFVAPEEPDAPVVTRIFCLPGSTAASYGASGSRKSPFRL